MTKCNMTAIAARLLTVGHSYICSSLYSQLLALQQQHHAHPQSKSTSNDNILEIRHLTEPAAQRS